MKAPTEDGLYPGLKRELYDRIARMNVSTLVEMKRSPFHLRAAELQPKEQTDAMLIGSASHVATLEPERWLSSYAIWDGPRRSGKEWEKFKKDHEGLDILTVAQRDKVMAIQKAVQGDENAAKHLKGGQAELTMLWTHKEEALGHLPGFSMECKGRIDFANGCITDLKTTSDVSELAFKYQCQKLDYHVRAAFYVDGYHAATGKLLPYRIVAVENKYPFAVATYVLGPEVLDVGRATYRGWLATLAQCRKRNHYPGPNGGQEMALQLPSWRESQEEADAVDNLEFEEEAANAAQL